MFRAFLTAAGLLLALHSGLPQAMAQTRVPQNQAEISLGFAPLVKEAAPAVVNIYAKIVQQQQQRRTPFMDDPFFEDFFRGLSRPQPRVQNSLGSGVILSKSGLVVSNYHVVGMATDIRVVTTDRREYAAKVVLADQASDLALLQLEDAADLPYLELRDSDQVEVGELALAIGNPFGVGQTVSSGIISGLARSGSGTGGGLGYFIQTDAPINPGNSGGALIDVNGDLIGINTRIVTRSGGSNGIGFAIPANLVRAFMRQVEQGDLVSQTDQTDNTAQMVPVRAFQRPWAGMMGQPVDADLAASLDMDLPEGMVISDLHPASPFAEAGFRVGDVVLDVAGQQVNSPSEMVFRMSVVGMGETATVTRLRGGTRTALKVAMIAAPNDPPAEPFTMDERSRLPGLSLARINPQIVLGLQLPMTATGVVITDAGPYGARVGLRAGDIVEAINNNPVTRPRDVADLIEGAGRWLKVDLIRQGQRVSLRYRL